MEANDLAHVAFGYRQAVRVLDVELAADDWRKELLIICRTRRKESLED